MALITGTSTGIDSRTADRVAAERMPCLLHPTSGSAQARTRSDPSQAPDTGRKLVPQPLRARHRGSQDISPRARARSAHQQHLSGTVGASTTNDSGNDRQDSCPPAPSGRWCATRETALRETIAFACSPSRQRRAHRRPTSGRDRTHVNAAVRCARLVRRQSNRAVRDVPSAEAIVGRSSVSALSRSRPRPLRWSRPSSGGGR